MPILRLDDVDERGGVVIGDLLALVDFGDEAPSTPGAGSQRGGVVGRHDPSSASASAARISTSSMVSKRAVTEERRHVVG